MKKLIIFLAALFTVGSFAKHPQLLTPEQEEKYFSQWEDLGMKSAFDYSRWNECLRPMSGNYVGANCMKKRRIGERLYDFLDAHMSVCVEEASSELNIQIEDFHIVHAGIFADRNHSPRSLHSIGRAIDIKAIKLLKPDGSTQSFVYSKDGHGPFYTKLRACWGKIVHEKNDCPVRGSLGRTATIGKENADHQHHLHVSVPYCIGGTYAGNYYRR